MDGYHSVMEDYVIYYLCLVSCGDTQFLFYLYLKKVNVFNICMEA